ncbi:MAG: hypothetical protein KAU14_07300, partial [Thermoplasmata archaeon]|nr:hypothetical protein [Thermoplasmata archaeon]
LEAGETVIVTMKVTIYDWNWYIDVPWNDQWYEDPDDVVQGKEKNTENTNPSEGVKKNSYVITLVAKSRRAPEVSAEAKTITHIYDETIQEGIRYRKISGVFNANNRIVSKEILEQGFEILPLVIESGKIEIKVRANFSEGRLVVLNLDASNLREIGDFDVLFDGLKIDRMDAERIINYTGEKARYALLKPDNGIQLLVYIPHFSEHIISIQSKADVKEKEFSGPVLAVCVVLGMVLGVIGLGYLQQKEEARKKEFKLKLHETGRSGFLTPITKEQEKGTGKADELESLLNESLFFEKKK